MRKLSEVNHMDQCFKNPYLNSVYAEIYIILVVSLIHLVGEPNTPDSFFDSVDTSI